MKRGFLLLPLLLLSLLTYGQHKLRPFASLTQHLSLQRASYRLNLSPQFGLQYKRHQWALGPVVMAAEFPETGPSSAVLNGAMVHYRYHFSKEEAKRLYLFGELSSKLQFFKESWTSNHWQASSQTYQDYTLGSREHNWGNYLGLGAGYKIGSAFKLQTSLAIGYTLSKLQPLGNTSLEPQTHSDYRGYDNGSISCALAVGASYYFRR